VSDGFRPPTSVSASTGWDAMQVGQVNFMGRIMEARTGLPRSGLLVTDLTGILSAG
jgi:hypothetical protein